MSAGIIDLSQFLSCEDWCDNCDSEDSDGVPCVDIEDAPCDYDPD